MTDLTGPLAVEHAAIVDIPEAQYHAETGLGDGLWLTRSMICDRIASARGFRLRHVEKHPLAQRKPQSKAMELGSMFDVLVTEGQEAYDAAYPEPPEAVPTPAQWRTSSGAISKRVDVLHEIEEYCAMRIVVDGVPATYRAWEAGLPDGCVGARDEAMHDQVVALRALMMQNPLARRIVEASQRQVSIRATLACGLRVQVRMDFWCERFGLAGDLKTTRKDRRGFLSSCIDYGYHIQAWLYTQIAMAAGLDVRMPFVFVCQQTAMPLDTYVVQLDDEVLAWAGRQTCSALQAIADDTGEAPQTSTYIPSRPMWLEQLMDQE